MPVSPVFPIDDVDDDEVGLRAAALRRGETPYYAFRLELTLMMIER